jgi:hypothetical protein
MKHAQSFVVKLPLAFPSLICGIIQYQHPGILLTTDVASKRETLLSLHYKLFAGTHVPNIVVTPGQGAANLTSKEGILDELKDISKTLEETIRTSTERKISVDKVTKALSNQKEDADLAQGIRMPQEMKMRMWLEMAMMMIGMSQKLRLDSFSLHFYLYFFLGYALDSYALHVTVL